MKRLVKKQKRQAQRRRANLRALAWIFLVLLIGVLLGSFVQIAIASDKQSDEQEEPISKSTVQYIATGEPELLEEIPAEPDEPELVYLGEFTVTHYCPCSLCCGQWADGITATGTTATEGRTIAVDPTVIPYGSEVIVYYEDGTIAHYIAEDCGGAIKGNRLDVYMGSHRAALAAGVKTASVYVKEEKTK